MFHFLVSSSFIFVAYLCSCNLPIDPH